MPSYLYEVIQPDGKEKKGTIEAANEEAARIELKATGNMIVSISMASALSKDLDITIGKIVKPRELSIFCRQFQSILNAGVTVIDALGMLGEQTKNKKFSKAILEVKDAVQKGETLAAAMEMHPKIFPEIMIHMIEAGEASGSLETAFDRMGSHFEKDAHLKGVVAKSMIYPIVLIVVIIAVVVLMMVKIIPTFMKSFEDLDAELPAITVAVMSVSNFFVDYWMVMLGIILVSWFLIHEFKKTENGAMIWGQLGLHMPLFGNLTIKSASARLTRTLSTLLASGISLVDAIEVITKIMSNEVVKRALEKAQKEVVHGIPLSQPLEDAGVFPPMVYQMIRIGEETGNMEEMLDKVAEYYDEEVELATESLVAFMEPMIIIIMALVVVPIILAVMMPMFSLYNSIG